MEFIAFFSLPNGLNTEGLIFFCENYALLQILLLDFLFHAHQINHMVVESIGTNFQTLCIVSPHI